MQNNKEYPTPRSFLDFLQVLIRTTQQNINFMRNLETHRVYELDKYKKEIESVQSLINTFKFEIHETPNPFDQKWIDVNEELPLVDGSYEVTNHPEKPFDLGVCEYNGLGFIADRIYRNPKYWRYMHNLEKKYGKQI